VSFEETVHFIPRSDTQQAASLRHGQSSGANRLKSKPLQGCSWQFAWIRNDSTSQVLGNFQTYLHRFLSTIIAQAEPIGPGGKDGRRDSGRERRYWKFSGEVLPQSYVTSGISVRGKSVPFESSGSWLTFASA
jgi:hypothetical protein